MKLEVKQSCADCLGRNVVLHGARVEALGRTASIPTPVGRGYFAGLGRVPAAVRSAPESVAVHHHVHDGVPRLLLPAAMIRRAADRFRLQLLSGVPITDDGGCGGQCCQCDKRDRPVSSRRPECHQRLQRVGLHTAESVDHDDGRT